MNAAHTREIGDYLALARRRWVWITACVLVGALLAAGYVSLAPQTWVSTAKVLVKATEVTSEGAVGARTVDALNLDTEAQLVSSQPVATLAGESIGSDLTPVALASRVTVSVPPNTTVLGISYSAASAEEAQAGATAFAEAYLALRREEAQTALQADVDRLRGLVNRTRRTIEDTSVEIARLGPSERADRAFLLARRATSASQLSSYTAQLAPLAGSEIDTGSVIVDAGVPLAPSDPDPRVVIPAGIVLGLLLGLALAAWRERADRRVHAVADVERLFGAPVLAALTMGRRGEGARFEHDVSALLHTLRASGRETREVVTVVAPGDGDLATHLTYSLADAAARGGERSVLLSRPGSAIVARRRDRPPGPPPLLELTDYAEAGALVDGTLSSTVLRAEVTGLLERHDLIWLGMPHDDPSLDIPALARLLDLGVVVVSLGVSRRDEVAAALADLSAARVSRVVLVSVDLGRRGWRRRAAGADGAFQARTAGARGGAAPQPRHGAGSPSGPGAPMLRDPDSVGGRR